MSSKDLEILEKELQKVKDEASKKQKNILKRIAEHKSKSMNQLAVKTIEYFEGKIDIDSLKSLAISLGLLKEVALKTQEDSSIDSENINREEDYRRNES
ncbi:hypothetical protein JHD48_07735 [Sulfurimonas sp. SAG-AH-194-I05]|nr:hypothetical protein [Sulfurimonas sp. SAG-AH-194-I05]MDF1875623.1 hypothetical protein [Sulfurimonas sp. SAG-AH-194-I05]